MHPTWLIDVEQAGTRSAELQEILRTRGIEYRPVKFYPERKPPGDVIGAESIPIDARVIYFGGPALMEHIQRTRRWRPGGWCTFANFHCEVYYCYFGQYLLNEDYVLLPACEAVRQSQRIFARLAVKGEVFFRPAAGRKHFNGQKVDDADFRTTLSGQFDPRQLVVVSSPKPLQREWRLFIADDQVITASQYAEQGEVRRVAGCPDEVTSFARQILSQVDWRPDPLFTMDIAESNGRLAIVELNGFSCSHFYMADLELIVEVVSNADLV